MWNPRQRISTPIWYMEETESIFHIRTQKAHISLCPVQKPAAYKGFSKWKKSIHFTLDVASRNFTPTFLPTPFVFPQSHLLSPVLLQQSKTLCKGSWRCPGVQACCHKEAESKTLKIIALRVSVRVSKSPLLWAPYSHPDFHGVCWEAALGLCCVRLRLLPGLLHEDFEAIWAGGRDRKVEAVAAHSPNDGWRVHVLVGDLSREQLP